MADIRARLLVDTNDAKKSVNDLKSAFKALVSAAAVQQFVSLGDEFTQITNRLKSVSASTADASSAFNLVKKVAAETRSGLGPVADLFADLTIATEEMGLSQEQVAATAATFSKALKVSGADANASSGAIRQFGQALASGVLRGDEFNSIMEANPAFMRKVAETLNVTTGQLRKMAEQGLLTSDILVTATQEIGDSIDEDFAKTVSTVGEAFVALKNSFIEIIGRIEENTGVFTGLANTIQHVADNLDVYIKLAAFAFGVAAVKGVMNLVKAIQALQIVTKAQTVAQAALTALMGPKGWAILAGAAAATTVAIVGINKALAETEDAAKGAIDSMGDGADAADDTAKNLTYVTTELEKQVDLNKDGILQAAEKVELQKLLLAEQKKQKAIEDEKARIAARQLEIFEDIETSLKEGAIAFDTQLALQADLFRATANEARIIQAIAKLEDERAEKLEKNASLHSVDADKRKKREQEINEEYDNRIALTTKQLSEQNSVLDTLRQFEMVQGIVGRNAVSMATALSKQRNILKANTQAERDRANIQLALMQGVFDAESKLNEEITAEKLARAKELEIKVDELSQKELDAINERFKLESTTLEALKVKFGEYADIVLAEYELMREASRSFAAGFKDAFIEFEDTVNNAANFGRNVFQKMTQGWEDAFVKFAETGKLSFKDLFKTLMTEIIKMMANKLFLALFMPGSGVFGSLFAGFFNNGGTIPAGKIGIVGESGPEIVRGPGTVISTRDTAEMLGGGTTHVTYNIQAVDAPSFQALVARDPEFIFNVSRAGARRVPG